MHAQLVQSSGVQFTFDSSPKRCGSPGCKEFRYNLSVDTFIHRAGRTSVSGLTIRADLLVTFFGSVGRNQLKFSASMPDHLTALGPMFLVCQQT
mmetsp:Transcript_18850/g.45291  ORF Transcript_18850/g.45291 Transcript_18850/m.45291 type:complete len:94 (-) Transcript_18850:646-927(-)